MTSRPSALSSLEVAQAAREWRDQRRAAVVVAVRATRGSVPREAGTRMVVCADEVAGTIGGGHLEQVAIERARQMLREGDAELRTLRLPLGPALGQCCGGEVTLELVALGRPSPHRPSRSTDTPAGDSDAAQLADPDRWPAPPPRFELQLYGAGHVGRAIVALLAGIACRVQWIDEREDQFPTTALPAHIERVCVEPVEAEVDSAPAGAFFLVLTHSHDLDLRITEAILKRGDFAFLGLIGSATKRARFTSRLLARGIPAAQLERMHCPIGLAGIRGKEPEVIAVSVVAQLLQARETMQQ